MRLISFFLMHLAPGEPKSLVVSVPQLPDGTYMIAWRALSAVRTLLPAPIAALRRGRSIAVCTRR